MKHSAVRFAIIALLCAFVLCLSLPAWAEGGQVSGTVWYDKDGDGLLNAERGLPYVRVTLCTVYPNGQMDELASARTGDDGQYAFSIPEDGTYALSFELPADYRFTLHGLESCALPAVGEDSYSLPFTVSGGQVLTMNCGAVNGHSYISIIAFEDANANGGRRNGEPLIRNVKVELFYTYNGVDYSLGTVSTDKEGETNFSEVSPGTYYLKATLPENYVSGPMGTKMSLFYNYMEPSIDNVCYSPAFTVPHKGGVALGIGMVKTGSVEGTLWLDANGNNLQDDPAGICPGVSVTLTAPALGITRSAVVNADGTYSITGLQPAQYELAVTLPPEMIFANSAASALNAIAGTASLPVEVKEQKTTVVPSIGAAPASQVEVKVSTPAGAPLSGVKAAISQGGQNVSDAVSGDDGVLRFPAVRSGDAIIQFTLPEGYLVAREGGALPYAQDAVSGTISCTVPLQDTLALEGTAVLGASISGQLFEDAANTGIITEDCPGLSGFTVAAVDENGQLARETVTDENGLFTLAMLLPGEYTVRFMLDDRYIAAPYAAGEDTAMNAIYTQEPLFGETQPVSLAAGEKVINLHAALFKAGITDGYVLLNPALSTLTNDLAGMEGVTVNLLTESGLLYQDYSYSITDENGYFCIKGILPGRYSLQYVLPADAAFVTPLMEGNTYHGPLFEIGHASEVRANTLGAVWTASLSGTVTDYTSGQGVSTLLTMTSASGETYTANTDGEGSYSFTGLLPGAYTLSVDLQDGYVFADSKASVFPYYNQNAAAARVTLPMGLKQTGCNIVASQPVDWDIYLFSDENANGLYDDGEPAAANREASLYLRETLIGRYTADEGGVIRLSQVIPAGYTLQIPLLEREELVQFPGLNTVTIDQDQVCVALLQYGRIEGQVWCLDGTENGVDGLTVTLLKDGAAIAETVTDAVGAYHFDRLLSGEYALQVQLKDGYLFARESDAAYRGSYIIGQTAGDAHSMPILLSTGHLFESADIGIGGMGAIGDTAWVDENANGMQDIGEPPLPGIEIALYQYGQLIASAVTDDYGHYSFKNLYPGVYQMQVTMPKEVKSTIRQTQFPLVASILPESDDTTVTVESVVVPSMGRNLNVDLGFRLRKKNVYPSTVKNLPQKDWTPYADRTEE